MDEAFGSSRRAECGPREGRKRTATIESWIHPIEEVMFSCLLYFLDIVLLDDWFLVSFSSNGNDVITHPTATLVADGTGYHGLFQKGVEHP